MKERSKNPRFDVDFKTRQSQSRESKALSAYRAIGRKKYFVKAPRTKEDLNKLYGNGPVKTSLGRIGQYILTDAEIGYFLNELFGSNTETRWLKPKEATLLRLQGYAVEEAN
jgi:hypothetical protein